MARTQGLNSEALEAALPTLTKKLKELQNGLSADEKAVFSSIVSSAALHLKSMEAIGTTAKIEYAKPISAAATAGVRKSIVALPKKLGLLDE